MLKKLVGKLKSTVKKPLGFTRDERGNVMILTAFAAPMLMMATATAIDMGEMYRAKTNFQVAVDAATLAFAKEFNKNASNNEAGISDVDSRYDAALPKARAVFQANMANLPGSAGTINFDIGNGDCNTSGVKGVASMKHDVFFPAFHKLTNAKVAGDRVEMNNTATVRCSNTVFEIALVLDNSGSMGDDGKMTTLRSSAQNLVNKMFNAMNGRVQAQPVQFSLIPFAATVNVGKQYADEDWMDTEGKSPIHHENLNWEDNPNAVKNGDIWQDQSGDPLTRFSIFDALPDYEWAGCVEALPHPYSVQNVEPTESEPGTLIVPVFAPDTPDNWTGQYDKKEKITSGKQICRKFQDATFYNKKNKLRTRTQRLCEEWTDGSTGNKHSQDRSYKPEYNDDIEYRNGQYKFAVTQTVTWEDDREISEKYSEENNYIQDQHNFPYATLGHPRRKEFTGSGDDQQKRQKWSWKYFADSDGDDGIWEGSFGNKGTPNDTCTTLPLTPLTDEQGEIIAQIQSMYASGATNIQQGISWGWRTLSDKVPFTNARPDKSSGNRKILIVMSDGANTYYPSTTSSSYSQLNKSRYGAYGHSANERIFEGFDAVSNPSHSSATFTKAMDEHTAETCQNVKRDDITVYSIAFKVDDSATQTLLRNCASKDLGGKPLYFDASTNAALDAAFEEIYNSLSELRLAE